MFSTLFGKKRASPVEDKDAPPIPAARSDDFVVINPTPQSGNLYPNVGDSSSSGPYLPYPTRPAPVAPPTPLRKMNSIEQNFSYLQGVPFTLCKSLQMASNQNGFAIEIGDLLAFTSSKMNLNDYDYDFSVERSVLKECS